MSTECPKRRQFLTEPGEQLLLCQSAVQMAVRYTEWLEFTGVAAVPDAVVSDPVVAIPLPVYEADWPERGLRRWPGTRPEAMWHPLMWLPRRLSGRYELAGTQNPPAELESDQLWAVRVCLELTASGLYDPDHGWVDILDTAGLDIDNATDLLRVRRWLDGADDDLLDSIDLSGYLDITDQHWAVRSAIGLVETLVPASWAVMADDLIEMADDLTSPEPTEESSDNTAAMGRMLTSLAQSTLVTVPADPGKPAAGNMHDFWSDQLTQTDELRSEPDALLSGPIAASREKLYEIRDRYWAAVEDLEAFEPNGNEVNPVEADRMSHRAVDSRG